MQLNTIGPGAGSKRAKRRVGRGSGSGWGKTAGRGQKGQKARSGSSVPAGFEGGQQPLQVRVPKFGFRSRVGMVTQEVRLDELAKVSGDQIDLDTLRAANVIRSGTKRAAIMLSGTIARPVTVRGIRVTRGARAAIEAAGGKVEG